MLPKTILSVLTICFLTASAVPARNADLPAEPLNLDLEQGAIGEKSPGWFVPASIRDAGYTIELTETGAHSGERCAVISHDGPPPAGGFGNLMQTFDASAYRGKRVRFRAAVRTALPDRGSRAQLWLRVDRSGKRLGFFDNMADRPITSREWTHHEIVGPVTEDAENINIGALLIGQGKVFIDDVSFEVLGDFRVASEPARPLDGRGLKNLVAFARLLGYVRYFYPGDEATEVDWETFAIQGVRRVESAPGPAELASSLQESFEPIAPAVRVFQSGGQGKPLVLKPPEGEEAPEVIVWRHLGVGTGSPRSIYSSNRVTNAMRDPGQLFHASLGGGVELSMPIALYRDEDGTLPRATGLAPTEDQEEPSGNDRGTRLAAVVLGWNVFQHFYPYLDVVDTDWGAVLPQALSAAATDPDEEAFLLTLRRMVAALDDGHGRVRLGIPRATYRVPLLWEWVEDRLIVLHTADSIAEQVRAGDVVLKIDGTPAETAVAEAMQLISGATIGWKRWSVLNELAFGPEGEEVTLELQRGSDDPVVLTLRREVPIRGDGALEEPRPAKVEEIRPGIFYLDLQRISDDDLEQALPDLAQARGIICDMRGYPGGLSTKLLGHLADEPMTCARWNMPIVTRPDRQGMDFKFSNWKVDPQKPRLSAKVAFLTDGRAISYAETYMGIVEHYRLAEIVGSPTAGTNGNSNPFQLPGGYRVSWTGLKVLKHDGSQHHGIGILPTVPLQRTIAGVAAGRDEVLERAIEIVSRITLAIRVESGR